MGAIIIQGGGNIPPPHIHLRRRGMRSKKKISCSHSRIYLTHTDYGLALVIDGHLQFAEKDEYIYHEALVHPAMAIAGDPKTVLIIGGGDGLALREVLKWRSVEKVYLVDVDKCVVNIGKYKIADINKKSLHDKRVKVIIGDGRKFLEETNEVFDVIIIDSTDPTGDFNALKLFTLSFYELARSKVKKALVTNAGKYGSEEYWRIYATISKVFPYVIAYSANVPSFGSEWGFVLASVVPPSPSELPDGLRFVNRYFLYKIFESKPEIKDARVITEEDPIDVRYFAGIKLEDGEKLIKGYNLDSQVVGITNKRVIIADKSDGLVVDVVPNKVDVTEERMWAVNRYIVAVVELGILVIFLILATINPALAFGLFMLSTLILLALIYTKFTEVTKVININDGEAEIFDDSGEVYGILRDVFNV